MWRRQWHPTPVLLPGISHGRRILVGCSPWGRYELDTTERLHFHFSLFTFMHGRRRWQPTPVFLPGESQGRGSLVAAVYEVTQSRTWLKLLSSSSNRCSVNYPIIIFMGVVQGMESKRTWADSVTVLLSMWLSPVSKTGLNYSFLFNTKIRWTEKNFPSCV